jgi:hypothetical protein
MEDRDPLRLRHIALLEHDYPAIKIIEEDRTGVEYLATRPDLVVREVHHASPFSFAFA